MAYSPGESSNEDWLMQKQLAPTGLKAWVRPQVRRIDGGQADFTANSGADGCSLS
jgi:hypothetical protein